MSPLSGPNPQDPRFREHPDRLLAELAGRQGGVVAGRQLRAAGLSSSLVARRIDSGQLHPRFRDVFAVGHPLLGPAGLRWAAVLAGGPGARASFTTAAAALGIGREDGRAWHVTVPGGGRSRRRLVVHHAALGPDDVADVDGLPVTSFARTALDLAGALPAARLLALLEQGERMRLFDLVALHAAIGRWNGHRGTGRLARALEAYDPAFERTESELERLALDLVGRHGLPAPIPNHPVAGFRLDLFWPEARVALELDGWDTHRTRRAFERDRLRDRRLRVLGIETVRSTWRQATRGGEALAADLAAILARRAGGRADRAR